MTGLDIINNYNNWLCDKGYYEDIIDHIDNFPIPEYNDDAFMLGLSIDFDHFNNSEYFMYYNGSYDFFDNEIEVLNHIAQNKDYMDWIKESIKSIYESSETFEEFEDDVQYCDNFDIFCELYLNDKVNYSVMELINSFQWKLKNE